MKRALYGILAILLVGCQKFNHKQVVAPTSCEWCNYADELEGTYYGKATGYMLPGMMGLSTDSLRVTVEHFYKSEGVYIDSTIMFIRLTFVYNSQPQTEYVREIEMRSPNDFTYFTSETEMQSFSLNPEELRILYKFYNMSGDILIGTDYTGLRE